MDIKQAQQFIMNAIKSRTDELSVFQMASDILNNTFVADFTSLETAQQEANDLAATKNVAEQAKIEAETKMTSLTASLADKDSQIADLQTKLDTPVDIINETKLK